MAPSEPERFFRLAESILLALVTRHGKASPELAVQARKTARALYEEEP